MLDKKQNYIFHKILSKFKLPHNNIKFIQHRNLNEFRYFMIERINPNHVIQVYGKLKRPYLKDNHPNKIIKVGEILLSLSLPLTNNTILLSSLISFHMFYTFFIINDFEELILEHANRYRREYRKWKNTLCRKMCIN